MKGYTPAYTVPLLLAFLKFKTSVIVLVVIGLLKYIVDATTVTLFNNVVIIKLSLN